MLVPWPLLGFPDGSAMPLHCSESLVVHLLVLSLSTGLMTSHRPLMLPEHLTVLEFLQVQSMLQHHLDTVQLLS